MNATPIEHTLIEPEGEEILTPTVSDEALENAAGSTPELRTQNPISRTVC
jgi:hypothetical protein